MTHLKVSQSTLINQPTRQIQILLENFNPKSLSEIAADTSAKLPSKVEISNTTSTPKYYKKDHQNKKQDSSDLDLDCTLDIRKFDC